MSPAAFAAGCIVRNFDMSQTSLNSQDIEKWLKLLNADGVGPVTFNKLLTHLGSIDNCLGCSVKQLTDIEGIGIKKAESIARTRDNFDAVAELELADSLDVWLVNLEDSRYPIVLKKIYDPPPVLYIKGTLTKSDNLAIAIVGSRHCSLYGQEQTSRFAHLLASAGFTICSGLARGIDSFAHQSALAAGGRTIAVQGCGLANIYPPENKNLFNHITQAGAVISELPLRTEPNGENFPARNRIIAGLCLGTIVVEAGFNSGALITAKFALDYEREVMAIPGRIDSPLSRGTNLLIKQGAKIVESITDVTEALGYIGQQLTEHAVNAAKRASEKIDSSVFDIEQLKLSNVEKTIYNSLNNEPIHIEQIIADTGLNVGNINSSLISLQLKGIVKQMQGGFFVKR